MSILNSRRLDCIFDAVYPCKCAADIGCDHGLLSVALAVSEKAEHVIASDISEGSLDKAIKLVSEKGLEEKVECVLSDGLSHLKGRLLDVIIIAGMGGPLISGIIERGFDVAKGTKSILCPHSNADDLRIFLCGYGFEFLSEKTVREDRRFYPVMTVRYTGIKHALSLEDAVLGKDDVIVFDDEYKEYLAWFCELESRLISEMRVSGSDKTFLEIQKKEKLLDAARRRLNCR